MNMGYVVRSGVSGRLPAGSAVLDTKGGSVHNDRINQYNAILVDPALQVTEKHIPIRHVWPPHGSLRHELHRCSSTVFLLYERSYIMIAGMTAFRMNIYLLL